MIWILNIFFILILLEVNSVVWTWFWIIATLIISAYIVNRYGKKIADFYEF